MLKNIGSQTIGVIAFFNNEFPLYIDQNQFCDRKKITKQIQYLEWIFKLIATLDNGQSAQYITNK